MDKISTHIQRLFKCGSCISENGEKIENFLASDTPVLNPILKLILEGVYDEESNLSTIRGCPHVVMKIWFEVKRFLKTKIILPSKIDEDQRTRWSFSHKMLEEFTKDSFISELFLPLSMYGVGVIYQNIHFHLPPTNI